MRRVIYHATPAQPLSLEDFVTPVRSWRRIIRARGLTSLWIYVECSLLGVIEGEFEEGVDASLLEMSQASWLWGMRILLDHAVPHRLLESSHTLVYVPGEENRATVVALRDALMGRGGDPEVWLRALRNLVWSDRAHESGVNDSTTRQFRRRSPRG